MKMKSIILGLAAVCLTLPAFAAGPREGKWQITMKMEMEGMPGQIPPQTMTHCVTKEQAEHPEQWQKSRDTSCKILDSKMDGNKLSWKIKCDKGSGEGEMTFGDGSYTGESRMDVEGHKMTVHMEGKRLGDCDK